MNSTGLENSHHHCERREILPWRSPAEVGCLTDRENAHGALHTEVVTCTLWVGRKMKAEIPDYYGTFRDRPAWPKASPVERRIRNRVYDRVLSGDIVSVERNAGTHSSIHRTRSHLGRIAEVERSLGFKNRS